MKLFVGAPRSGKTTRALQLLCRLICRIIFADPQFELAQYAARQTTNHAASYYERLSHPGVPFLGVFESPLDGMEKIAGDLWERRKIWEILLGRRNIDALENPLLAFNADLFLRGVQYQRDYFPLHWLPYVFNTNCTLFDQFCDGITHEPTRVEIERLRYLPAREQRFELGPMERLMGPPLRDPTIMYRCGTHDIADFIRRHNRIYVEGQSALPEGVYGGTQAWFYGAVDFVRTYREPLVFCVGEAANIGGHGRGIFTEDFLRAAATMEKLGLELVVIVQSIHQLDEDIRTELLDLCNSITCFRIASPATADILAEVMATPRLDPDEISHSTWNTRQFHDGYEDIDEKIVSKYRLEYDLQDHYRPLSDQVKLMKKTLMTLRVGECVVNERGRVWKEQTPPLRDPYPWGLSDRYLDELRTRNQWSTNIEFPEIVPRAKEDSKRSSSRSKGKGTK